MTELAVRWGNATGKNSICLDSCCWNPTPPMLETHGINHQSQLVQLNSATKPCCLVADCPLIHLLACLDKFTPFQKSETAVVPLWLLGYRVRGTNLLQIPIIQPIHVFFSSWFISNAAIFMSTVESLNVTIFCYGCHHSWVIIN